MSLVTSDQRNALKLYLALMEEAKSRIHIINHTYQNNGQFPPQMVREICYLQFRFLCEMIALGCLVIHEGIKKTKPLRETYEPKKILRLINDLKPNFYPRPMETKTANGRIEYHARLDFPHLSQEEVGELWTTAGTFLHRGKMVSLLGKGEEIVRSLKPVESTPDKFPDIFQWSKKIVGLLNFHWITLADNKRGLLVSLLAENNRAKASILDFNISDPSDHVVNVQSFDFQPDR